jgi:hypothetical protein
MTMPNDPVFKPGDLVKDFRGDHATVLTYRIVPDNGKSNRMTVRWDVEIFEDKTEYYASVFEPV